MDYTKLCDFEINVMVADKLGLNVKTEIKDGLIGFTEKYHEDYPDTVWVAEVDSLGNQIKPWEQKCYTSNWEDIGPIIQIIAEDLFLKPDWCLLNNNLWEYWIDVCGGNMCRAAAIVYLMSGVGNE